MAHFLSHPQRHPQPAQAADNDYQKKTIDKDRIYHHPLELGCTTSIPPLNGFNCLAQPASVECGASTPSHVAVNPANAPELQALAYG